MFVDVFSVTDFCYQVHKGIIMNLIDNAVISRPYFMEIVATFHFCCSRVRQIFSKSVDFPLYSYQFLFWEFLQTFFDGGSELYRVCHVRCPVFSRTARPECPHPVL